MKGDEADHEPGGETRREPALQAHLALCVLWACSHRLRVQTSQVISQWFLPFSLGLYSDLSCSSNGTQIVFEFLFLLNKLVDQCWREEVCRICTIIDDPPAASSSST